MPADGIGFGQAAVDMDEERQFCRVVAIMEVSDHGDANLTGFAEACTLLDNWYFASPKDRIDVLIVRQVGLTINGDSVILSADAAHALADVAQEILVEIAEGRDSRAMSDMVRALRTTAHAVTRSASSTVASQPSGGPTMRSDTAATSRGPSLRDKLHRRGAKPHRRGAKPHRRMSDLSRYMLDHYDELHALIAVDGYGWADIAGVLSDDEGLTDESGRPVTADVAKLAWSRLDRRNRRHDQSDSEEPRELQHVLAMQACATEDAAVSDPLAATLADFGDRASALAVDTAMKDVSSALRPLQRCRDY